MLHFQLYQASAGAGKTFLLVQQYLAKLLSSEQEDRFHRMLALTFTNKAVFEMKFRILQQLHYFAHTQDDISEHPMGEVLLHQLNVPHKNFDEGQKSICASFFTIMQPLISLRWTVLPTALFEVLPRIWAWPTTLK